MDCKGHGRWRALAPAGVVRCELHLEVALVVVLHRGGQRVAGGFVDALERDLGRVGLALVVGTL